MYARTFQSAALALVVVLAAAPAPAHDVSLGIGGKKLLIKTGKGAAKQKVRFVAKGESVLTIDHDPADVPTWLLVRGYGPEGGTTGKIVLDPARWKRLGKANRPKGYKYVDRKRSRGGVQKVLLKDGKAVVIGGGPNWPWAVGGPQESVWLHLGIDDETYCAMFGGEVQKNESGSFKARNASPPNECPQAVCGNAEVELGEACDDGNLVEDDGCTSDCEVGNCVGEEFASTFAGIAELVFNRQGCNDALCHGSVAGQGGLSLLADSAYDDLIGVPAEGSSFRRVEPGAPRDSALYLKLLKASEPDTDIAGEAMPNGSSPIPEDLLEAVSEWILNAAPEAATVASTQALLGGCYPEPTPISVQPLPDPDPSEGIQVEMPPVPLGMQTEVEVCLATYYDVSDLVPEQFKDPTGEFFYSRRDVTRQDPHSHHLVILNSGFGADDVTHEGFGTWRCGGGTKDGQECDPLDQGVCGPDGICHSEIRTNLGCFTYGPPGGANAAGLGDALGGAGNGQSSVDLKPGLYRKIPLKALVYWNVHAFNVTSLDHDLKAYLNIYFTDQADTEVSQYLDVRHIYVARGQEPYTRETYCRTYEYPLGTRVITISSHTHERGKAFWVNDPDGNRIYENYSYEDPVVEVFDPPLVFDDPDPARRTVEYCATYSNGLDRDDTLNPLTVRTRTNTPPNAFPCTPTHCTDGKLGSRCDGEDDHAACDSISGANDGFCDACAITAGVSTQDEMFVLVGWSYTVEP